MAGELWWLDLGRLPYREGYAVMRACQRARARGSLPDLCLFSEPDPVYTVGRAQGAEGHLLWPPEVLAREGIEVFPVDRGGDVTYHGPGQLVGYPILDLRQHRMDLHWVIDRYEETLIRAAGKLGLTAHRRPGYPGVWVGREKLAAIGIAVRHWVTYHGFALNVDPNLAHFRGIIPCGITDGGVTSLALLLGQAPRREEVRRLVLEELGEVFRRAPRAVEARELAGEGGEEVAASLAALAEKETAPRRERGSDPPAVILPGA